MYQINIQQFVKNLRTTVEWTSQLSKNFNFENGFYGKVFRSINPLINGTHLYSFDEDYFKWEIDEQNVENYKLILDQVITQREVVDKTEFTPGRILCFTIGLTTNAGIAIIDSDCFMDECDVPPIDTWFYIGRNSERNHQYVLFCWIPDGFQNVVQKAMDLDMMKSYFWLDEHMSKLNKDILNLL